MYSKLTAVACCCLITVVAVCQKKNVDLKFGDIKPEDFKPEFYSIDSSADAVYLFNIGSARYDYSGNQFSVFYKVHKRIRLLHKKSFDDLATVKISFYRIGNDDYIKDFQAATYTDENGKIVTTKIDKSSLFKDKEGSDEIMKFTFPDLKEGCIIEYTYTKVMAYANLPRWNFQSDYPQLWNEYTVETPEPLEFVVLQHGYLTPAVDTLSSSFESYMNSNIIKHTWAYKDVPALKDESYITSLSNYRQSIEFQISALRIPGKETQYYMHSWYQTAEDLMNDEDFGADLNNQNGWLKDDVKSAINGETDSLEKVKKIFEYVRNNYSCVDYSARFLSQPLKKTQQTKKGNVADINMLMMAMQKLAGFSANPVLLSTRDHGKTYDAYPILSTFNYLIAQVYVNGKSYLLDASNPILGFNQLSEYCYNGNARVIATEPVLIDLSADSLHQSEVISLFMSNGDDGKITGSYKHVMNDIQSENLREKMKKINQDDYFKDVKKSFSFDVDMDNKLIDSLKQPDKPIAVEYDLSFKPDGDVYYFTPVLGDAAHKKNPFSAAQRFYPVEMPYCTNETYVLNMEIPKGYKVDELPKPARVSLNDTDGMFEYLIQQNGDNIQLRCVTKLNKATFEPDDYETLRNFFAFIVEKESEQIVFKKL